jgi:hypothetical protein
MWIIGCDFHPSWQQVSFFDPETGETGERKLVNGDGEAERFYRGLPVPSLIGVEACGNSQWFIELLQKLGHEVWVGDADRFVPATCAGRRRIGAMRRTFCNY